MIIPPGGLPALINSKTIIMKKEKIFPLLFTILFIATGSLRLKAQQAGAGGKDEEGQNAKAIMNDSVPRGIRAILLDKTVKEGIVYDTENFGPEFSVYTFDARSMAMHVDQATWDKKLAIIPTSDIYELPDENIPLFFEYKYQKRPMYFDRNGNIYVKSKSKWVKAPFSLMKNMMNNMSWAVGSLFPGLKIPTGKVTYYGIDVSPDHYPILEWAFRYKVHYFEAVPELLKEFTECQGQGGCLKYTVQRGKDKGSYVLFDGIGRLVEISSINSGRILFTYGQFTVNLPEL